MMLSDTGAAPTGGVWTYPMTPPGRPETAHMRLDTPLPEGYIQKGQVS